MTWRLISTRLLEIRKRRGLMFVVGLLTFGIPFLVIGLRLVFHLFDPTKFSPAGSPGVFDVLTGLMAEFGFIAAAVLGTSAGTTDLSDGVFRHLVITGRSRVALFAARIPAGLAVVVPCMAAAFAGVCLVAAFAGSPQPTTLDLNGIKVPLGLSEPQLKAWLLDHTSEAEQFPIGGVVHKVVTGNGLGSSSSNAQVSPDTSIRSVGALRKVLDHHMNAIYAFYSNAGPVDVIPPTNEMVKIGLWLELDVLVGFIVGLGLGSLTGQRTAATVIMIVFEVIVSPLMAHLTIPYMLNGQRLFVGVALDQLRPAGMVADLGGGGGGGGRVFGGHASLGIPAMPTWAMISVIVGWVVVWIALGAWRMATRDT